MLRIKWSWTKGIQKRTFTLGIPFAWIITGWIFMLLVGALHLNVSTAIPLLSYGWSCLIMFVVQVISLFHNSSD